MEILQIRRDDPRASAYLPFAINRIKEFCVTYDTESLPDEQGELVWQLFASNNAQLGLWIVIDDYRIVGHLYATPEPLNPIHGYRYVLIRQAEIDPKITLGTVARDVFSHCAEWAQQFGVSEMLALTHRNPAAMTRRWGGRHYKSLIKFDLGGADG